MAERGVSVAWLAEQLSLSPSSFYRRLNAPENLTISEVQMIKGALGLSHQDAAEIFFAKESHEMRQAEPTTDPQA